MKFPPRSEASYFRCCVGVGVFAGLFTASIAPRAELAKRSRVRQGSSAWVAGFRYVASPALKEALAVISGRPLPSAAASDFWWKTLFANVGIGWSRSVASVVSRMYTMQARLYCVMRASMLVVFPHDGIAASDDADELRHSSTSTPGRLANDPSFHSVLSGQCSGSPPCRWKNSSATPVRLTVGVKSASAALHSTSKPSITRISVLSMMVASISALSRTPATFAARKWSDGCRIPVTVVVPPGGWKTDQLNEFTLSAVALGSL